VRRTGSVGAIFALGTVVDEVLAAADLLRQEGQDLTVVDARFLKPLDTELLVREARRTGRIVTVEEHVLLGGFGSAVREALGDAGVTVPTLALGLPDRFIEQGSQEELRSRYGLDAAGIAAALRKFLAQGTDLI